MGEEDDTTARDHINHVEPAGTEIAGINTGQGDVPHKTKVCRTMVLYAAFLTLGIAWALIGPTLLDLELLTHSDTETISMIFMGRSIGGLVGAILSGFAFEKFNHWLALFAASCLSAVGFFNVTAPWSRTVAVLALWQVIMGASGGFVDAGGNMVLLGVWGDDSASWMQALHCIFGIGTLLSPLIAEPFLAKPVKIDNCTAGLENLTAADTVESGGSDFLKGNLTPCYKMEVTRVTTAYLITAACLVCVSASLFVVFLTSDRKIRKPRQEKQDGKTGTQRQKQSFIYLLVSMLFVYYLCHCMLEIIYGNYIVTFSVKYLHWSKTTAALLNSVYWGVYTVTRVCGIFIIRFAKPQTILYSVSCILIISITPMLLLVDEHEAVFWFCSLGVAVGIALIFPTGISWAQQYIDVSGRYGAVFITGGFSGELVGAPLVGALFQAVGPMTFIYISFTGACLILLVFTSMHFIAQHFSSRNEAAHVASDMEVDIKEVEPMKPNESHHADTTEI